MHHRPQLQPMSRNNSPLAGERRSSGIGYSVSLPIEFLYAMPLVAPIRKDTHGATSPSDGPRSRSLRSFLSLSEIPIVSRKYGSSAAPGTGRDASLRERLATHKVC